MHPDQCLLSHLPIHQLHQSPQFFKSLCEILSDPVVAGMSENSSGIFEIVATVAVSPQDGRDNLKDSRTFLGFLTAGYKTSFPSHSAPAWLNMSLSSARWDAVTGKRSFTLPQKRSVELSMEIMAS